MQEAPGCLLPARLSAGPDGAKGLPWALERRMGRRFQPRLRCRRLFRPTGTGFGGARRESAGRSPCTRPHERPGETGIQARRLFHSQEGTGTYGPFSPAQGKLPPTFMRFHWRGKSAAASRMTGAGPMMTPKRRGNAHPPTVSRLRERGMGGDPMPIRNASPRQRTDGKRKLSFACLCCKNCILWIFCCLFSGDLLQ